MMKSEYAIEQVRKYLTRAGQPVKLDDLITKAWLFTDDGDPRWVMVALMRLNAAGDVRYLTCDDNHNHDSDCAVEAVNG